MLREQGEASIRKGVRQCCFVIMNIDLKVQGETIKILGAASDIAVLANTERELEDAFNVTETVFIKFNIKINTRKN